MNFKWLITRVQQKKHTFISIHYESGFSGETWRLQYTCTTCNVSLCTSTCTSWAEELAMVWLHGVDNKVHVTGREAGADPGFSNRGGAKSFNMCMQRIFRPRITWHHIDWQWHEYRKMVARLSCDWRAFTCGQFATTSALEVIAWLSHGDRMVDTRHHLPLLCDQTDRSQAGFEHVQKPNFVRTFTCVHLRLL